MEFEQESGGEAAGDASFHKQITDPGEQRRASVLDARRCSRAFSS